MSKNWFHYCLMNCDYSILLEGQIVNKPDAIFTFLAELIKVAGVEKISDIFLCLEHTGIYVKHLVKCWLSKSGQLSLIHAPKVGQALTGRHSWENKEDALDARRIAEYGIRFQDKLEIWQAKNESLEMLQSYQRLRDRLMLAINTLRVPVNESKEFDSKAIHESLTQHQAASIKALKKDLKQLEQSIEKVIQADAQLNQLFKLITSVEGVGPVIAREMMIATGAFTDFLPNQAKAFAKYAGVVPNRKQSGKSVRKKDRIGKRSHKKVKSLLTMGALSTIGSKGELSAYYYRKIAEGKHHFTVLNAMRNKMILRIFAVVRNQVMYDKNLNGHLVLP